MNSEQKILQLLSNRPLRPADLAFSMEISPQALHRHLLKLSEKGFIEKIGKPPKTFYQIKRTIATKKNYILKQEQIDFINQHYGYLNSSGNYQTGMDAFHEWAKAIGQEKSIESLAMAFIKTRNDSLNYFHGRNYVSGKEKLHNTFEDFYFDDIFFEDFYSLPQFGKTPMGCLLTMAKGGQDLSSIKYLAEQGRPIIEEIIHQYNIECIGFLPHSIPRKISFLHEYKKLLAISRPGIEIVKAFTGGIPIAQKSLSKLQERIENAQKTIFIKSRMVPYQSILLIDDAVGSGATMNETARKLKNEFQIAKIYGFAIAGSLKGFDVIADI